MSALGVLTIAMILPQKEISLTAGTMQAINSFFSIYHLKWMVPVVAFLIVIGALASLSTWIVGPSRGLLAAAEQGNLPPLLRKVNKKNMPKALLIGQALVMTLLSFLFVFMPSFDSAYWILTVLVAQAYLIMYILMFTAAIYLRYKAPKIPRSYRVPGGKVGIWCIGILGIATSLFSMFVGFFPPANFSSGDAFFYVFFLITGVALILIGPSLILYFKKPYWNHKLPHEQTES
jgi:amino acid transporter